MATHGTRFVAPRVNVIEEDERVVIEAEVPGVTREDTELEVRDGQLILKATRGNGTSVGSYRLRERSAAGFYREFSLHDSINPESVEARLENGVLSVTLNKSSKMLPRTISVN